MHGCWGDGREPSLTTVRLPERGRERRSAAEIARRPQRAAGRSAAPRPRDLSNLLVAAAQAAELAGADGIALDAHVGLQWAGFPCSRSSAWHDELTAILRDHGLDHGPKAPQGQALIADVKSAAVASGRPFTLAPPGWQQPPPDHVTWSPLVGHPLTRRTRVVRSAVSRRRDLGRSLPRSTGRLAPELQAHPPVAPRAGAPGGRCAGAPARVGTRQTAVRPPSTGRMAPCTKLAVSPAR